ncbi:hypothetical protein BB560_001631, partial [Smittium megazygosporum]
PKNKNAKKNGNLKGLVSNQRAQLKNDRKMANNSSLMNSNNSTHKTPDNWEPHLKYSSVIELNRNKRIKTSDLMKQKYMNTKDIDNITQSYSKIYSFSQSNFDVNEYLNGTEKQSYMLDSRADNRLSQNSTNTGWFRRIWSRKTQNQNTRSNENSDFRNAKLDNSEDGSIIHRKKFYQRKKVLVFVSFIILVILFIGGFFLWPRVPTIIATDIALKGSQRAVFNDETKVYGMTMVARLQYSAISGSFYPQKIDNVSVELFSAVGTVSTQDKSKVIASGRVSGVTIKPLESKTFFVDVQIEYYADAPNDPTVYSLFKSCAPINSKFPEKYSRSSDNLILSAVSKVSMSGPKFYRQSTVVNTLSLVCPK